MPFIGAAIAAAVPIIASISAAWAAIGIVGQTVVLIGLGVASQYLMKQFMPKSAAPPGGVQFEKQYGTNVPRQVAMGKVGIAGHDAYINTTGHDNYYAQQIFIVSDYYTTALSRVWINGELVSLGDGPGESFAVLSGKSAGYVWFTFYDGRQTTASGTLVTFSNPPGRWSEDNVGTGVSYIVAEIAYDKDNHNEYPEFFFEVLGAPLYDWRKDDTAGGTGDHRWNDVDTHEFSENPPVMEYNYRRGLSVGDDQFCGMFMPASDLPLDKFTVAANLCDELDPDGEARYRCSLMVDCGAQTTFGDIIKSIALSCGAMSIDGVDGSWPLVGSDQPIAFTFTDDDIISVATNYKYNAKKSMGDLVNSVMGNFPDIDQQWSPVGYEPQTDSALLTIDRRSRDVSIDFPMVYWARQAANLASIYLYENRYEASATITLRPRFQGAEGGDWCQWVSARYGWTKTFLVSNRSLISLSSEGPRNVVMSIQERDGEIYDGVTPAVISIPTPNDAPVYIDEVDSFALIAISVTGANGRATPAIRVSWLTIVDNTVDQVELQWFPTAQSSSVMRKIVDAKNSIAILADGIVGNTEYTVQARIIATPSRPTVFNAGDTVTTINITVGLQDLNDGIAYQVTELQNLFDDRLRDIEMAMSSIIANQDARNWLDKREVRSQLSARSLAAFASIDTLQTVMVAADGALASSITTLVAQVADVSADIEINATAIADLDSAFTTYQVTVSSTYATLAQLATTNANVATNASAISTVSGSLANYVTTVSAAATYATLSGLATTNANVTTNASAVATLNGYAAAQYSITLDVNGYGVGFNLLNGGGGISAAVFTVAKFKIASPGVGGGAPVEIFTVGNVAGVPKVGIRGDAYIDGTLNATAIIAGTITGSLIAATTISASNIVSGTISTTQIAVNGVDILNIVAGAVTKIYTQSYGASTANTLNAISLSGTIVSGTCLVILSDNSGAGAGGVHQYTLKVDGVNKSPIYPIASSDNGEFANTVQWVVTGLSNASHTFTMGVSVPSGSFLSGGGVLTVIELRR